MLPQVPGLQPAQVCPRRPAAPPARPGQGERGQPAREDDRHRVRTLPGRGRATWRQVEHVETVNCDIMYLDPSVSIYFNESCSILIKYTLLAQSKFILQNLQIYCNYPTFYLTRRYIAMKYIILSIPYVLNMKLNRILLGTKILQQLWTQSL